MGIGEEAGWSGVTLLQGEVGVCRVMYGTQVSGWLAGWPGVAARTPGALCGAGWMLHNTPATLSLSCHTCITSSRIDPGHNGGNVGCWCSQSGRRPSGHCSRALNRERKVNEHLGVTGACWGSHSFTCLCPIECPRSGGWLPWSL